MNMNMFRVILVTTSTIAILCGTNRALALQIFSDDDFVVVPELNHLEFQKTELNFAQWNAVSAYFPDWMPKQPWDIPSALLRGCKGRAFITYQPNYPVSCINWFDATEYVKALNQVDTEYQYRLPTKKELSTLVRLSLDQISTTDRIATKKALSQAAWYIENANKAVQAAAQKIPVLGLYDIIGNISEWTSTRAGYHEFYACGGNAHSAYEDLLKSDSCSWFYEEVRVSSYGFRLVRIKK